MCCLVWTGSLGKKVDAGLRHVKLLGALFTLKMESEAGAWTRAPYGLHIRTIRAHEEVRTGLHRVRVASSTVSISVFGGTTCASRVRGTASSCPGNIFVEVLDEM